MAQLTRLILILAALATAPGAALGAQVGSTGVHLSPQLAAGPGGSPLLVAMTDHGSGMARTEMWRSLNAGAAWTRVPTPPVAPPPTAIDPVQARGTPAVAFGASDAYVAFEGTEVRGGSDEPCSTNSGVFVARSSDGAASFAPAVQVAPSHEDTVRGRPSVVEFTYASGPDALTAVEAWPCGNPSGPTTVEVYHAFYGFYLRAAPIPGARRPVLAAGGGQVYLAYLTGAGSAAKIEVRRCALDPSDGSVECRTRGSTAPFTAVASLPAGGPAISSAPDLAVDASGVLHVAWTALAGARTEVRYSRSGDGGVTWTVPQAMADTSGAPADEFLPAVAAAPNLDSRGRRRVDVSFLSRRVGETGAAPSQASTDGLGWGATVPVTGGGTPSGPATVNGGQTFGERTDALSTAPPASPAVPRGGHGNVVVPRGGAISYLQQPHGSTSPTLSGVGGAIVTGKNVPAPVGPPAVMDADGDPVTLTTTAAMGDVETDVYRPRAGYAGADAIRFTASDGYGGTASAEQPVTVSNATPVVLIDAQARSLVQGSSTRIGLAASDADRGDTLTWSLTSVPSTLAGRVAVTPAGELAVDLPPGLRSVSPLPIGVQVSDTTPQVAGTALGTVYVKVQPTYGPVGVTVTTRSTGQTVQFSSVLEDADLEAAALVVRPAPRYLWVFGEGATPRTSSLPNPRVRFASGVVAAGYTLTVTVPRTEGESVTPAVSGRVALRPDGRSLLAVDQRVDRRRTRLVVSLRSRAAGTVQVALRIRGRRSLAGRARVTAGPSGTLGRRVDVSFDLRGVRARTADLVVTYADGLAGPSPTAVRRKLRLR